MIDIPEQISTVWIAAASVAFLIKHFLADFLLQTDWMAAGKDRPKGWLLPLAAHAGVHGAMTAALFLIVAPPLAWLGLADMLIHGVIDRLKSISTRRSALTPLMWHAADRWFADQFALTDLLLREALD